MLLPDLHKSAPEFVATAVLNGDFRTIKLTQYKGKYVVLIFYPLDFSFVCPTELTGFSQRYAEFRESNCEILAISTDSQYSHLAWTNMAHDQGGIAGVAYPIIGDKSMAISRKYGVLNEETGVANRAVFIIDTNQLVRQVIVNDLAVGRSVDETLRLVQAYQYTDLHGEVCPLNWEPGDRTIKPTPDQSKVYFQKLP